MPAPGNCYQAAFVQQPVEKQSIFSAVCLVVAFGLTPAAQTLDIGRTKTGAAIAQRVAGAGVIQLSFAAQLTNN